MRTGKSAFHEEPAFQSDNPAEAVAVGVYRYREVAAVNWV
jgi:hypothetical protein